MRYQLAVIVPTKNEAENVKPLLMLLEEVLHGMSWELIFVDDDSQDGTADRILALMSTRTNVRCLRRVGRRGLSSAAIEGMMASGAQYLAVMDADLQHDESLLPKMLQRIESEGLDIVIASRFLDASDRGNFSWMRERLSRVGNYLSNRVIHCRLSDPMSGFFMVRRSLIEEVVARLNGQGFKILIDIFASAGRPLKAAEMAMVFRARHAGESKLDSMVSLEFLLLLADKVLGRLVPLRFVMFILVGITGLVLHLSLLAFFFRGLSMPFLESQVLSTLLAMTSNFFLNNKATYRDRRLAGRSLWTGLLSFCLVCSVGAVVNFMVASFLFAHTIPWMLAGLVGAGASSVWNYAVTAHLTWTMKRTPARIHLDGEEGSLSTNQIPASLV